MKSLDCECENLNSMKIHQKKVGLKVSIITFFFLLFIVTFLSHFFP